MKLEEFVLEYLKKTKKKRMTTELIKESFIDTFHVGDSFIHGDRFLGIVEKSVIIGFNEFGAWVVEEEALQNQDIQPQSTYCVPYQILLGRYYDSDFSYKKKEYEISEVDFLKYKIKYDFLRKLDCKPCLAETDYFESYLNKNAFQIFCTSHAKKIFDVLGYVGLGLLFIAMIIWTSFFIR